MPRLRSDARGTLPWAMSNTKTSTGTPWDLVVQKERKKERKKKRPEWRPLLAFNTDLSDPRLILERWPGSRGSGRICQHPVFTFCQFEPHTARRLSPSSLSNHGFPPVGELSLNLGYFHFDAQP